MQSSGKSLDPEVSRLLWIYGLPGAGKTVISSTIVEYIVSEGALTKEKHNKVAYFYGNSMEKTHRTAFNICASLLSQLVTQIDKVPNLLLEGFQIARRHGRPRICEADGVFHLFKSLVATLPPVFLVLDALDECTEITSILSWLKDVVQSVHSFHVVCLSRDTIVIHKLLRHQPSIRMDAANLKGDIDTYLTSAINNLPCTEHSNRSHIFNTLSNKAEGMFLLADLSIKTLRSAINEEEMQKILSAIPDGVNEMYILILRRISAEPEARRSLASQVLRLTCFSAQPMTWSELRYALSWNENEQKFRRDREPFKDTVCELCCPLIEHQSTTDTLRLAHSSLHEFLCGEFPQSLASIDVAQFFVNKSDAQRELASITMACVADVKISLLIKVDLDSCPLVAYATKNWYHHLCQSPIDGSLRKRYFDFVASPERRSTWILRWLLFEERAFALQQVVKIQKLLLERLNEHSSQHFSVIGLLNDTQRALFHLDKVQSISRSSDISSHGRVISNFERVMCIRDLAREYTMASELDHGVKMFESALEEAHEVDDDAALGSCWLLNGLGILYDQQGKTDLARETQLRALTIQEHQLPQDHLDIVLTVNELGRVARHLRHFNEAETLHRRALRILEALFPKGDLQIVWTRNALGRALLKQNRPDEAIELHREALATECDRLGRDHPHTLWTLSDIARCYSAQGNIESAITTQQEVMERSESTMGINNPDTLWAKNSLGNFYELSGRFDKAREFHAEALRGQTEHLGSDHSHTVWSRQTLARLGNSINDV